MGVKAQHHCQFSDCLVGTSSICLADYKNISNFQDTSLDGLNVIAHARGNNDQYSLGSTHHFYFGLPGADGLNDDGIVASSIHCSDDITSGGGETSHATSTCHATDKYIGVSRELHHANAVSQNGSTREGTGRVDGDDSDFALATT